MDNKSKNLFKKSFSTSIFNVLSNLYRLSLSQMAGCERYALKGGKGKGKKKRKEKGGKNGDQYLFFFISLCACFFICAVVIFQIYKENFI